MDLPSGTVETPLISARAAAARLGAIGMPRRQARLALGAGLAGDPLAAGAATLYDAARVDALVERPHVVRGAVFRECPYGLFLDRRVVDVRQVTEVGAEAIQPLRLGLSAVTLVGFVERAGTFPYVATVCGFVVLGAEIVAVDPRADGRAQLRLAEPGRWFDAWRGRRWSTGPGREWSLLGLEHGGGVAVKESGT